MPLPPRGSAQDVLLEEIQRREQSERVAFATLICRLLGGGLGVRSDLIEAMLSAYRDEVSQDNYRPEYLAWRRKKQEDAAVEAHKKKMADEELLKKLDRFSDDA